MTASVVDAVGRGLPILLSQLLVTIVLLVVGVLVYTAITPFREHHLIGRGNTAAGIVLAGAIVALAIPLSALLATTAAFLDIVVWGVVALVLQLVTLALVLLVLRRFRAMIESGNIAAALTLAAAQIAVALLNAAAMIPT